MTTATEPKSTPTPQIKTGTEPATYGDLVALPGIVDGNAPDGIDPATGKPRAMLWLIWDARKIADVGRTLRTMARLMPWHPANPDSDNPAHHAPRPYGYNEPLKIGRVERVGVGIALGFYADRPGIDDTPRLRAYPAARDYSESLTDAQRSALSSAVEAFDGPRFHLPPLTSAEIRARGLGACAAGPAASARPPPRSAPARPRRGSRRAARTVDGSGRRAAGAAQGRRARE